MSADQLATARLGTDTRLGSIQLKAGGAELGARTRFVAGVKWLVKANPEGSSLPTIKPAPPWR
ncbi:hypothetical protein [Prosthecobacter sp.]